jgi:hypothetical protein
MRDTQWRPWLRVGFSISLVLGAAGALTAAPPDAPTGETPADDAAGVEARPLLCVDVSDPDGDSLTVTFHGRRLTAEEFSIVGLPDTQYYSQSFPQVFDAQTQWIVDNKDARNIEFVSHFGDIVQSGSNSNVVEWNRADASLSLLEDPFTTGLPDGIAYGLAPGNHDQSPIGSPRSGSNEGATTNLYTQHFGLHRFDGRVYYGGRYDFGDPVAYPDNNDNNYQLFSAGGMDFIAIHLEYDANDSVRRQAVLDWADSVLMLHSDRRALITSHFVVTWFAAFSDQGAAMYEQFKDNPNVFLMMGGHQNGANRRIDTFQGHSIHSYLADYQNEPNGGDGWLRIMTFDPDDDEIRIETYSPWLDSFRTNAQNQFTLAYNQDGGLPWVQVGAPVSVASGGTACVPWPGKRGGEEYEWYAEVSDAGATTTGPVWRFESTGDCTFDSDCLDADFCTVDICSGGFCMVPAGFDEDGDGICENLDNCKRRFNAAQAENDGDGLGNLCDVCVDAYDPSQLDDDADGAGDLCDCQPIDPGDREPATIESLSVGRSGTLAQLTWTPSLGSDAYSVSRGELSTLGASAYGPCQVEGLALAAWDDPDVPPLGNGYFYLVQGQNYDCGLGPPGTGSDELARENLDPLACIGGTHDDARATSENTVYGTPSGTLADTTASDDVWESIAEELSSGNPSLRHSRLEHRWTIDVPAAGRVELHVEGFRTANLEADDFQFAYSTDGGSVWNPIGLISLPTADNGIDLVGDLPASLSGPVLFRVVDTDRTAGNQVLDTVSIDELFVRTMP